MSDAWLNYQYVIEFTYSGEKRHDGQCSVTNVTSSAVKHGTGSYMVSPVRGGPVKHYVYGGSYTEPLNVSIVLGEGARPWLKWFSEIQSGAKVETRNITLSLYGYGQDPGDPGKGQLWLRWDLINCFPVSWQISPMSVDDGPSPMHIDMSLQFESMIIMDGNSEMNEVMG